MTDFAELRRLLAEAPCLSVRQPWAELILLERKRVELRQWPSRYRGWTWLHTGSTADESACSTHGLASLFRGGFVGAFRLRDIVPLDDERWEAWRDAHLDPGPNPSGVFGWVIGQVARLEQPVEAPGSTGLYYPSPAVLDRVLRQQFVGEP